MEVLIYDGDGSASYFNNESDYEHKHETPIAILRIVMSLTSILGAASIIVSTLIAGQISNAEVHPLFMLSVADFILALCWMLGGVLWLQNDAKYFFGFCYFLAIITVIAEMVTFLLTLVYAVTALMRVIEIYFNDGTFLPLQDKRKKPRHTFSVAAYLLAWLFPVVTIIPTILSDSDVLSLRGRDTNTSGCQISFTNVRPFIENSSHMISQESNRFSEVFAGYLLSTFIISAALMILSYLLTIYYLRKIFKLEENNTPEIDKSKLKKISTRVLVYLLIFFFAALPSFVAAVIVLNERKKLNLTEELDHSVIYWQAVATPLQGALNAIVYGWSRKSFRHSFYRSPPHRTRNYGTTPALTMITESSLTN